MKIKHHTIMVLLIAVASKIVVAYEVQTHEEITDNAFANIEFFANADRMKEIGITDISEKRYMNSDGDRQNIREVIKFGSNFEDEIFSPSNLTALRFLNHFYDPQQNGKRGEFLNFESDPSPDWILEDIGDSPEQRFSYKDATENLYNAFTEPVEIDRNDAFSKVFQTMGHLMHHMQDMAQPEHVRDDIHPSKDLLFPRLTGEFSLYEVMTNDERNSLPFNNYNKIDITYFNSPRELWDQNGISNQTFDAGIAEYTSFNFISKDTNLRLNSGVIETDGVHAFPEANGFTERLQNVQGTPSCDPRIDPSCGDGDGGSGDGGGNSICSLSSVPSDLEGNIIYYSNEATDKYLALINSVDITQTNSFATARNIFSFDIEDRQSIPGGMTVQLDQFTIDRNTIQCAQQFLIPRATAYSTAIVDYFFRGRLQLVDRKIIGDKIEITIKNISEPDNAQNPGFSLSESFDSSQVEFEVYYESTDNNQRKKAVVTGGDLSSVIDIDDTHTLTIDIPDDLDTSIPDAFVLVFKGTIGEQQSDQSPANEGVIGLVFDVPLGSFIVTPDYAPDDGLSVAGESRAIYKTQGEWKLSQRLDIEAGNVDWKGNNPGDVLTWDGPASRSFFGFGDSGSPRIYYHGDVLSNAPAFVLGASIRYDSTGQKILNAVTGTFGTLSVYSRPFLINYENDGLFNEFSNPNGWKLLDTISIANTGAPSTPFFFNGSGTEGQSIFRKGQNLFGVRVKLNINGESVTKSEFDAVGSWTVNSEGTQTESVGGTLCEGTEAVCVQEGNCPSDPANTPPHCILNETLTSYNFSADRVDTEVTTVINNTVICADYIGDQEVLCELTYDSTRNSATSSSGSSEGRIESPLCGGSTTSESSSTTTGTDSDVQTSEFREIKIGNLRLPYSGSNSDLSENIDIEVTETNGVVTRTESGNFSRSSEAILENRTRYYYIDARNNIAAYEIKNKIEDHGSGISLPQLQGTQTITLKDTFIVNVNGNETVIYEESETTPTPIQNFFSRIKKSIDCGDEITGTISNEFQFTDQDRDFSLLRHPQASIVDSFSFSVSSSDDILISLIKWKPIEPSYDSPLNDWDIPYEDTGTFNMFTGGDLTSIVPTGTTGSRYSPSKVIQ